MALKCGFKGEMGQERHLPYTFLYLVLLSSFLGLNVQLTLIVGVFTDVDDLEVRSVHLLNYT